LDQEHVAEWLGVSWLNKEADSQYQHEYDSYCAIHDLLTITAQFLVLQGVATAR